MFGGDATCPTPAGWRCGVPPGCCSCSDPAAAHAVPSSRSLMHRTQHLPGAELSTVPKCTKPAQIWTAPLHTAPMQALYLSHTGLNSCSVPWTVFTSRRLFGVSPRMQASTSVWEALGDALQCCTTPAPQSIFPPRASFPSLSTSLLHFAAAFHGPHGQCTWLGHISWGTDSSIRIW